MRGARSWAVLLIVGIGLLPGCSGTGRPGAGGSHPPAAGGASGHAPDRAQVAVSGPWRAWTSPLAARQAADGCATTARQIVCGDGPDGFAGHSRASGATTWSLAPTAGGRTRGKLLLDAADERAVIAGGRGLRAANLRTGRAAWTHRLPLGRSYTATASASGTVYALDREEPVSAGTTAGAPATADGPTAAPARPDVDLGAFRASDGAALWHRSVAADFDDELVAIGHRVYGTDGTTVTARDADTGDVVAHSPAGTVCPHLIAGAGYLVCTGSPLYAGDTFPPLRRLDPATLRPLRTAEDTGMKPERGLISASGILMLFEDSAEDPGGGTWTAYDLEHVRSLWSYATTTKEGGLADGRFVTFTPVNEPSRGRLITIDLKAGPRGTGAARPRTTARFAQTSYSEHPVLLVPGEGTGHVVVQPGVHHALRSIPLP